jgi:hypothetical protein
MKHVWLIVFLASALAATPPKKPTEDYSSWNAKWFATCQGESFIVNVKVGNPKSAGSHSFNADFLPDGGLCSIGSGAPLYRTQFLFGTMESGKITGKIVLCTTSQELVDANPNLAAFFPRHFTATYDPKNNPPNITDANYKSEHYKREDDATGGKSGSKAAGSPAKKPYQRDEPGDREAAFEMHLYRGPAYDQVTHHEAKPGPSATPPKLGEKAHDALNNVIQDGVHEWMNDLRKMLGADPI